MNSKLSAYKQQVAAAMLAGLAVAAPGAAKAAIDKQGASDLSVGDKLRAIRQATSDAMTAAPQEGETTKGVKVAWWHNWHNFWHNWHNFWHNWHNHHWHNF